MMNKRELYESIMHHVSKEVKEALEAYEDERIVIDKSKIRPVRIKNIDQLVRIVEYSYPDKKTDSGFWLFDEALKKDYKAYGSIGKAPWYINYIVYLYEGEPVALRSYSTLYYSTVYPDERFRHYVRLLDFQVDSRFKGNDLQNYCNKQLEKQFRHEEFKGVTLQCYKPSLYQKYKRDGYKGNEDLMWKDFDKDLNEARYSSYKMHQQVTTYGHFLFVGDPEIAGGEAIVKYMARNGFYEGCREDVYEIKNGCIGVSKIGYKDVERLEGCGVIIEVPRGKAISGKCVVDITSNNGKIEVKIGDEDYKILFEDCIDTRIEVMNESKQEGKQKYMMTYLGKNKLKCDEVDDLEKYFNKIKFRKNDLDQFINYEMFKTASRKQDKIHINDPYVKNGRIAFDIESDQPLDTRLVYRNYGRTLKEAIKFWMDGQISDGWGENGVGWIKEKGEKFTVF